MLSWYCLETKNYFIFILVIIEVVAVLILCFYNRPDLSDRFRKQFIQNRPVLGNNYLIEHDVNIQIHLILTLIGVLGEEVFNKDLLTTL